MISEERLRQVELALWPQGESTPGSLWAILDCARDRQIHGQLVMSRLDYQCLYAGDVPTELRLVAPHMVELSPRYAFTRSLLSQGWGKSWGVFARISDPTALRHHLRKLLTVRDEAGRKLLFRFYDPRVLRNYLPTCTRNELAEVFGPVTRYLTEGPGAADTLISHGFDGTRLEVGSQRLERQQA